VTEHTEHDSPPKEYQRELHSIPVRKIRNSVGLGCDAVKLKAGFGTPE
jgi:hypothetical protein